MEPLCLPHTLACPAPMIRRAVATHQNSWEAFTYFSVSALLAQILKVRGAPAKHQYNTVVSG